MKGHDYYLNFAGILDYPSNKTMDDIEQLKDAVGILFHEKLPQIQKIETAVRSLTVSEMQEYYLKTFDVQAVCPLYLGYLLFGEDYKRAELLVNLQAEHDREGVDCQNELGDYLPNVLKLLARTTDPEFAAELGFVITIPAVRFMIMKFNNAENIYKDLLELLLLFLQHDFKGEGLAEYAFPEHLFNADNEFLMPSPKQEICETMCHHKKF